MILIITHKNDFTVDYLINILNRKGIAYKRFNCEDLLSYKYSIKFNKKFEYSIFEEEIYKSVWFRRVKLPMIDSLSPADRYYILNEIDSLIKNLFSIIDAKWVSNPYSVYSAENKLKQLKVAQLIGFQIPPTLITSSKKELIEFFEENNNNIIVKPISQTRIENENNANFIFTNPITSGVISNIEHYDLTPCIFQKNITKDYEIRVTVVENSVFAAAVYSQEDEETKYDWRRKRLKFTETTLPESISSKCIEIVKALDLKFGAIDIIKTKNNEYIFLEINPNGQWVWIENQTKQPISNALINALL